jgi:hypothetical protein
MISVYRIGIEELSGVFSGIVVDNRDSILFRETSTDLSYLLKVLVRDGNLQEEKIDYAALSTDVVSRMLNDQRKSLPVAIVRAGVSENNFSYKSGEYFFRSIKEPSIHSFFVRGSVRLTDGGNRVLDSKKIQEIGRSIRENKEIAGIGIIGLFSNFYPEIEEKIAAELTRTVGGDIPITLSSALSQKSLVYRESFLVSNLLLTQTASKALSKRAETVSKALKNRRVYFLRNDGSLLSSATAIRYPIFLKDITIVSKLVGAVSSSKIRNLDMIMKNGNRIVQMSAYDSRPMIINVRSSLRQEFGAFFYSPFKNINGNERNIQSVLMNLHKKGDSTIVVDKELLSRFKKLEALGVFPMQIDGYLGAMGAVSAPIRITADFLGSTQFQGRKEALEEAKNKALQKMESEGADMSTTRVIQADEIPLSYLPWFVLRNKISIEGSPGKPEQSKGRRG